MHGRHHTSGALIGDHHEFISDEHRTDADLEAEVRALELRRQELESDLAAVMTDEANQKLADELRQQVEELEHELADRQSRKE